VEHPKFTGAYSDDDEEDEEEVEAELMRVVRRME
jgi:hypothetical protein